MNVDLANAMSGYIETLYKTNQKLLKLCGMDIMSESDEISKEILDILQNIPRLVPYSYNNKIEKLELNNRNGLLEFRQELKYLYDDYEEILNNNYNVLDKIRRVRNKYEHKMHDIEEEFAGSGNILLFDFSFKIGENDNIDICSDELINLMKKINILFSKIKKDVIGFANQERLTCYRYCHRLERFDFLDFNKIYESPLLRKIGVCMREY